MFESTAAVHGAKTRQQTDDESGSAQPKNGGSDGDKVSYEKMG